MFYFKCPHAFCPSGTAQVFHSFKYPVTKYTLVKVHFNIAVALYAISAVYFAGVMVRLMLTLTPVVCVLSGIAFSILLDLVLREDEMPLPQMDNDESKSLYDKVKTAVLCLIPKI